MSLIFVVIPAYNAEKTIGSVINNLFAVGKELQIIVVDDGSTDATNSSLQHFDVEIISHPQNFGKGRSLRSGFSKALSCDAAVVATMDADGQHNAHEIPKLFDKMSVENADIVIGSRMGNVQNMPLHRILSNRMTSKLISWRVGQEIQDSQSGFRLIRAEVLRRVELTTNKFDTESELLLKAALANFKITEVAVESIYRAHLGSAVKIADIFRFIVIFLRSLIWKRHQVYV